MRIRKRILDWAVVYANSTTPIFHPATQWLDANDFTKVRVTQDNRAFIGNMEIAAAYQTANVENSPDSAVAIDSAASADGMVYPTAWVDLASAMQGKQLVRFGRIAKLSSGSTLALGNNWILLESAED